MDNRCTNFIFGGENEQICFNTFEPFQGIAQGGIFSTLAFLFNLVFLIMFIMWIVMLGLSVLDYIRSEGQPELMEQGRNRYENVLKGISLGLAAFVIISGLGVLLGIGSPLEWPKNFGQCARAEDVYGNPAEAEIFMSYVDNNPTPLETYDVWCCPPNYDDPLAPGGWITLPQGSDTTPFEVIDCEFYSTVNNEN